MKPRIWWNGKFWICALVGGDESPGYGDKPSDAWADWLLGLWLPYVEPRSMADMTAKQPALSAASDQGGSDA